ncbi:MAG: trypsin-like peptidase domain-containing protein [Candidatus Eisenbacteria bacterium]|nr:trypsin-like peptidase domain-containing protein [Candidatus Eisenbacteria bacterium]
MKPSIVTVSSQYDVRKAGALSWPLAKLLAEPGQGTARLSVGSGIVFAEEIIVTSGSVVRTSGEVTVAFEDGRSYQARVLGIDRNANVCVLRVTGLRARPIPVGNSRSIKVGSLVVLMGNSFGKLPTVALGTVSGRQRVARTHGKWEIIQLSGPVHPGNSGGAVLNTKGELVAMVMGRLAGETARRGLLRSPADVGQQVDVLGVTSGNVGLALPAEEVRNVVEGLLRSGRIQEGYLGVRVQSYQGGSDIARIGLSSAPGVEISEVLLGSPAQKAGLRNGDVLSEFDGEPVLGAAQLSQMVGATRPGERVKVSFWRGARRITATVQIGAASSPQSGTAPAARPAPSLPKTERVLSTEN